MGDMEEEERCEGVLEEDAVERPTRHSNLRQKIILLLKNENHLSKGCREANPQFSGLRLFFKEHSYFKDGFFFNRSFFSEFDNHIVFKSITYTRSRSILKYIYIKSSYCAK